MSGNKFLHAMLISAMTALIFGTNVEPASWHNGAPGKNAPKASQTKTKISDARPDGNGFLVHEIESEFQAGQTRVRVLLPENMEKDRRYPVVYVLSVEAKNEHLFGDGLAEFKKNNTHNKYKIICVAPTFSHMPWYADHPTDP